MLRQCFDKPANEGVQMNEYLHRLSNITKTGFTKVHTEGGSLWSDEIWWTQLPTLQNYSNNKIDNVSYKTTAVG